MYSKVLDTTEDLRTIMSQLPPNLESLTLDVPKGGGEVESWLFSGTFDLDIGLEMTPYRVMLHNVLTSVSRTDISEKGAFELRLYNVPPYHSLAHMMDSWKTFLSTVTSFVLGLQHYDNDCDYQMNTHILQEDFASRLGAYFWDHLKSAQSFTPQGDESWPLGGPQDRMWALELPLPSSCTLKNLRHVSFSNIFVYTMTEFLRAHLRTIETIWLEDCFAPGFILDDREIAPKDNDGSSESGATFLKYLSDARPPVLRKLDLLNISWGEDELLECHIPMYYHPRIKEQQHH